jgi:hypothetical protein
MIGMKTAAAAARQDTKPSETTAHGHLGFSPLDANAIALWIAPAAFKQRIDCGVVLRSRIENAKL